jgi:pyruvate dehydrogenase E1 component alpha subunit
MVEIGRTGPARHGFGFPEVVPAPSPRGIVEDKNMPDEKADLWTLYRHMLRSRLFEEAVRVLWEAGDITGEIHSGLGEEAVIAGVVCQLRDGDAMSLDHRGTAAMLMRGVNPVSLLRELLGREDGLCRGRGGHMHLFARDHLAFSSGIVGAAGPGAAGLALAARHLRPGTLAVAFFGEGAMNQGMLLEAFNLATAWRLPAVFVCKDDAWSITTPSGSVRAGGLGLRAQAVGLEAIEVDGADVESVWGGAGRALARARAGEGPSFLHARCTHLDGHMLGYRLFRLGRSPAREGAPLVGALGRALLERAGGRRSARLSRLAEIASRPRRALSAQARSGDDPVLRLRQRLAGESDGLALLERHTEGEVSDIVRQALQVAGRGSGEPHLQ